jgi:hypothetical protein
VIRNDLLGRAGRPKIAVVRLRYRPSPARPISVSDVSPVIGTE